MSYANEMQASGRHHRGAYNYAHRPQWVVVPESALLDITPPMLERTCYEPFTDRHGYEYQVPMPRIHRYSDCILHLTPTQSHHDIFFRIFYDHEETQFDVRIGSTRFVFKALVTSFKPSGRGIEVSLKIRGPVDQQYGESPLADVHRHLMMYDPHYRAEQTRLKQRMRLLAAEIANPLLPVPQPGDTISFGPEVLAAIRKPKEEVMLGHRRKKPISKDEVKANRYYVGTKGIFERAWGHADPKKAVEHATALLEANDGEDQFIVKIVKVVRRKPQPVQVEDVK